MCVTEVANNESINILKKRMIQSFNTNNPSLLIMAHSIEQLKGEKVCNLCGLSDFSEPCRFSNQNLEGGKLSIERSIAFYDFSITILNFSV